MTRETRIRFSQILDEVDNSNLVLDISVLPTLRRDDRVIFTACLSIIGPPEMVTASLERRVNRDVFTLLGEFGAAFERRDERRG